MNDDMNDGILLLIGKIKESLAEKGISEKQFMAVCQHEDNFVKVQITEADLKELLDLKQKVAFLPESFAYSLSRPGRGDYLLANFDSPSIVPLDRNEERFIDALHSYYQQVKGYKQKTAALVQIAESYFMPSLEEYFVESSKDVQADYIRNLRPGQLTDNEVIELVSKKAVFASRGRELESNFMNLPESFFPLIEQYGKYDRTMIDYVKVQRGIGRITPTTAYNSMDYFLTHRLLAEWNPAGAVDDYEETTGCYYYPNVNMKNPAEKFPPNLLNELQWSALGSKSRGEAAEFIPYAAYPKNRITGVQVYPSGNGGLNIRCMVDGVQQGGKQLSDEDVVRCKEERTDLNEMAVGYFTEAFAWEPERDISLKR